MFYTLYFDGRNAYQVNQCYGGVYDNTKRKIWQSEMTKCGAKWARIFDSDGNCIDSFRRD